MNEILGQQIWLYLEKMTNFLLTRLSSFINEIVYGSCKQLHFFFDRDGV